MPVEVATMVMPGEEADVRASWPELHANEVPLHLFPRNLPYAGGYSRSMNAFLEDAAREFDILHVHTVWEQSLALGGRSFRQNGKPYLVSAHGMLDGWSLAQSRLKKRIAMTLLPTAGFLKQADAIVYGTEDEAGEARHLGLGRRSAVVPNGVDVARLAPASQQSEPLKSAFPQLSTWQRTVLFYSRLHPKKGLDLLVEAFARVGSRHPGAGLLAVGIAEDRAYEDQLRSFIRDSGLQDRIVLTTEFTGARGFGAFDFADIFALPSHQEGFSMAIVEAMALAKPVLITDRCHMNFLDDAGAGRVTGNTVESLAAGLDDLLSMSQETLTAMGRRARSLADERFTWDAVGSALVNLYHDTKR